MPLHFDSVTLNDRDEELLDYLLKDGLQDADGMLSSADGSHVHVMKVMRDAASGERIGKYVFTFRMGAAGQSPELIDVDITLDGGRPTALQFLNLLPGSSDANEYYDVEVPAEGQRLQVETVNRHALRQDPAGATLSVLPSAFPFELHVHDSMDALDAALGFHKHLDEATGQPVGGLAANFAAPGSLTRLGSGGETEEGEAFSILVGTVRSVRDVTVDYGTRTLSFAVVLLETALGPLPTAVGREVFDVRGLAPGKVVMMYAEVKADFALDQ